MTTVTNYKQIKQILEEYVSHTEKITGCKEDDNIVAEVMFTRSDTSGNMTICLSNETTLCIHGYDIHNDWEISDMLHPSLAERLSKLGIVYQYSMGAFELYYDEDSC